MRAIAQPLSDLPTPNRLGLLKRSIVFHGLEATHLDVLVQLGRWVRMAAGGQLCREGDAGTEMYVIGHGAVVMQKDGPEGPIFLARREVGEVVGEMALLDNRPRSATVICETDCVFLAIKKPEFTARVRKHPEIAMGIIANLLDRLREADARSLEAGADVLARLSKFLLDEATLTGGISRLRPKPADRIIADRIHCSRETVSRKLTELEKLGIIKRQQGELLILDEDELLEISEGGEPLSSDL